MKTSAERTEESRDFWEQSAEHDKRQLGMSIAVGASGLLLAGVGVGGLIFGQPEGIPGIFVGGGITYWGGKMAVSDLEDYRRSNRVLAQREGMAAGVNMANKASRDV